MYNELRANNTLIIGVENKSAFVTEMWTDRMVHLYLLRGSKKYGISFTLSVQGIPL